MEAFELLFQGFMTLMTFQKLGLMMVGLVLGVFVGVLPGLGGPNGVAILLPLTFSMDPTSAIVMLSCLYGLVRLLASPQAESDGFINRDQLSRVMKVLAPTLAFVIATDFLGLYVASFLLVTGFMWWIGKIALWKSLLTGFLFTAAMFLTFEIAFNVIMPKGPLEAAFGF